MNTTFVRALIAAVVLAASGSAAIRWANELGNPYRRTDFSDIHFKLNATTAQGLVTDGDPAAAVQAALDSWNSVAHTALHFAALESTSAGISSTDRQNVIAFAATPADINALGNYPAMTKVASNADGTIIETDIILNPGAKFSMSLQPNTFDLQSVITHELGHALGANHATVVSATMYYNTLAQDNSKAQLKPDDASFAATVYPAASAASAYGAITGTASKDGAALLGAAVIASDPISGAAIGVLSSLTDGTFLIRVPAGNYIVLAQPLTGVLAAVDANGNAIYYNFAPAKIDTSFKAGASGGTNAPTMIRVDGGATVTANVAAAGGRSAIEVAGVGKVLSNRYTIAAQPVIAPSGQALDFLVSGPGLDGSIAEQDLRLIGTGVSIRPGSLRVENNAKDLQGRSPLRFTIDVGSHTSLASVSLFIVHGSDTALLSGGIVVTPAKPAFIATSLVNAASFKGTGVAPGELVSLFGTSVGPDMPVSNSGFDQFTGRLSTTLAGISVTFDGVPAPLIFTSAAQINLQVPYELAGHASTVVTVVNQGIASDPITVPVVSAQPGLFVQAGTMQAIALNQDNSVNSPSNPAARTSVVTLFATGPGLVEPPVPTGRPASGSPLSVGAGVAVTIGGANARVLFGGLTPGFVGLMQVNVEIPQGAPTGNAAVELTVADKKTTAPAATIAVK
ncbi:MAG: matrixin family metalloprotease [Acidobacteriota bacterium]|nr:matrixin family metalloprotease [Acidobacteriota bacterium]